LSGYNKTFTLGQSEVFKCWELALPQINAGDKVTITCPSEFVYGGANVVAPIGGEYIPKWSDVDFDLNVIDCNIKAVEAPADPQPVTTVMQPDVCMYLKLEVSDDLGYDLVLSA